MKLAVVHGPGDLRLDEVVAPRPGPDDVVIKVAAAGICGSDITYRALGGVRGPGEPLPIGHEFAGELVEVGSGVTSFRCGDRVAYNSGNSPADVGRGAAEGGFSELVLIRGIDRHPHSLVRVPESVSLEHAALVEPLSVALHGVNRADPKPGESVALFGAGPIGLGIVLALRLRGVEDVVVFDLSRLRRERALELGARAAFDPREVKPADALRELRGEALVWGQSFVKTDVFLDAAGAPGLISDIAQFCNRSSRIISLAIQKSPIVLDGNVLLSKELSLLGSLSYPTEFPQVMARLAEGAIDAEQMITHRFAFADFLKAFDVAADGEIAAKVLVKFP